MTTKTSSISVYISAGVGLVALDEELGCLEPNLSPNSTPLQMIKLVNELFANLHITEFNIPWWRYFPTKAMKKLEEAHNAYLEYFNIFCYFNINLISLPEYVDVHLYAFPGVNLFPNKVLF